MYFGKWVTRWFFREMASKTFRDFVMRPGEIVKYAIEYSPPAFLLLGLSLFTGNRNAEDEHYAAEAALRAGTIYFKANKPEMASKYFELAMDMDCGDDVYIEIIHKKAKNLLKEIEAD